MDLPEMTREEALARVRFVARQFSRAEIQDAAERLQQGEYVELPKGTLVYVTPAPPVAEDGLKPLGTCWWK